MIDDYAKMMGIINIEELKKAARRRKMLDGNGCQLCDYNGYTINHTGKSLMCSCAKDKIYKELFLSANVPRAYINKSIDDWNTRKDSNGNELGKQQLVSERVFTLLKFYEKKLPKICEFEDISFIHTGGIKQKLHSILFEGNIGSGKTFIAAVMVQSSLKKGYPAKYYDWSELVSCCSDYNKKTELDEIVEEFKSLEFVAIDGIEMYGHSSPIAAQNIDRLCKARMNSGKPTMLFSLGNVSQIQGGTGWLSLINKCIAIRLPSL